MGATVITGGRGGGGGGAAPWVAGTYQAGALVTRGPYVWMANATTTEDPLVVEGDLGSGSDWSVVTSGSPNMVQANGEIQLINNVAGCAATAYRQSVNAGFLGKMLICDLSFQGAADWMHFGVFDSAHSQAAANINTAGSTFYGVNVDIFNGRVENWIDGAVGTNVTYTTAAAINANAQYARWYLAMIQNGSNWDLSLYRDSRVATSSITGQDNDAVDDMQLVAGFTNKARPAYSNWRFVVGARTGGSAGTFKVRAAYVRNLISGNWSPLAKRPTGLG